MAETMRRCEAHGSDWFRDWCVVTEMARREGHRVVDLDPCRLVERVLSVPGELVDPADPADILAYVRTLPGVEEIVVDIKYDVEPFMKEGPFFVDFDGEIASGLEPGRYLIIPLSEEE